MKNRDLYFVAEGIKKCHELVNIADINFTMTIARINSEVNAEIRIINDGRKKQPIKYKEYLKKKEGIDIKYAIQKEDGTFQTLNDSIIVRNPIEYYSEIEILNTEYKLELDTIKSITTEFNSFLDQPCVKNITKLPKEILPASINVEQATLLFSVIE
jgi:hypothetical protein